jgi:nucleoside-diphosphate-sugar epimerase
MRNSVLVTGGSGFIGSRLIEKLVDKDYEVTAILRKTSKRDHLPLEKIKIVEIDLTDFQGILDFFTLNSFDYIIHAAGITKALKKDDYFKYNTQTTKNLIDALQKVSWKPKKFVYISSQAAHGTYKKLQRPIKISDIHNPITYYGKSKLLAERYIDEHYRYPYVILEPTSVYGPRDKDFLIVIKLISKGIEGYIGKKPQHISFIYVEDLVDAIILSISLPFTGEYFISDGNEYIDEDLGKAVKNTLGKKTVKIRIPVALAYVLAFFSTLFAHIKGKPTAFNLEKMKELKAKNWLCDSTPFFNTFSFSPKYNLDNGIRETIKWYNENNWL